MPGHSRSKRRRTEARAVGQGLPEEALSARRLALDEQVEEARGTPGEPAGFGTEASTSNTDDVELDSYRVPDGRTARLVEAALSIESNGEASVHVNGRTWGPFTGAVDVSLEFDRAFLPEGADLLVTHESTDGNSTTTKASVTVREV